MASKVNLHVVRAFNKRGPSQNRGLRLAGEIECY